ncbi:MAG: DUF6452 family protein [Bacteroidales bacterium]
MGSPHREAGFFGPALFAALMVLFLAGCQQEEVCEELTSNPLRIGFYMPSESGQSVTALIDSLTVFGLNRPEDAIYNKQSAVSRIELPLDPGRDSCAFVLQFPEMSDTLFLFYQRELTLLSVECGFVMFYDLERVESTRHVITGIQVNINQVTNSFDEHLKVIVPAPANND